jgi:hypothetical protein
MSDCLPRHEWAFLQQPIELGTLTLAAIPRPIPTHNTVAVKLETQL